MFLIVAACGGSAEEEVAVVDATPQETVAPATTVATETGWFPLDQLPEVLFTPIRYAIDSLKNGSIYYDISE